MITAGMIKRMVANDFGVTVPEMDGNCRHQRLAVPRAVAMWIVRTCLGYSYPQIGRVFRRDHTSVVHAIGRLTALRDHDAALAARADRLQAACRQKADDIPDDQAPDAAACMVDALVAEFRTAIQRSALRDPQVFIARALAMLAEREATAMLAEREAT
jgi:hypothetical protein